MPKKNVPAPKSLSSKINEALTASSAKNPPHLIIIARAGTGKTTTLVEGLKKLKGCPSKIQPSPQQAAVWDSLLLSKDAKSICFVAFNKSIADELKQRVPSGCDAMTMHSMGLKAVKNSFRLLPGEKGINAYRVDNIIEEIVGDDIREIRRKNPILVSATKDLVDLVKMTLSDVDEDSLDALASHYDIDTNGSKQGIYELVPKVIERCMDVNRDGYVDFADMIWIPVILNLPLTKYDLLLVDEAQDLNRCQQELAKRVGRRLVLCGDPKQAIYGFAGADSSSMDRMRTDLMCSGSGPITDYIKTLPLTVTRRCGHAIVAEAKKFVPDFEAFESNGKGSIRNAIYSLDRKDGAPLPAGAITYHASVQDGDMVICRVNAPLVSQCFAFIKAGRKATILGRDIGRGLISLINKLNADSVETLQTKLQDWAEKEVKKEQIKKHPSEHRILAIYDRADCIMAFADDVKTVNDVINKIQAVFTDNKNSPGIRLSSIHKAKGLEAPHVFLLRPKGAECPHPMAKTPQAQEQELNLLYVGITRAIDELIYVA